MASSYTDIGTELMTTGENAGTWGSTTNTNLQILEEAINGYVSQALTSGGTVTLTYTDGSTGDVARHAVIALTGALSGNAVVEVPANEKVWIIDNQSTNAYTVTVRVNGQTGVTWGTSDKGTKILYANGTDVVDTSIGGVGAYDLNGGELILDADADTSITADTDDQIDIKIAGADDFQFTANTFTAQAGSTIAAQALTATTVTASGIVKTDDTTEATSTTDGSLQTDGGLSVAKDAVFGDDVKLLSDSAVLSFGADSDTTLTHTDGTGLTLNSTNKLTFQDTGTYIHSNADGDLDVVSDGTAVDSINLESAGGITLDAGTAGSGIVYEDDGTEMARIHNSSSDVILETKVSDKDFLIKGNDGGSTITALTLDMSDAGTATFNHDIKIPDNGQIGSASVANAMVIDSSGKVTFIGDISVKDDIFMSSDDAKLQLGTHQDVTITHDPDDGLIFKSTATADDNPFLLTIQTGETDIAVDDVLGTINFQAPDEGAGTDAILVAAGIEAVSEGDFSSSNNATKLSFKTGASEAATEKVAISSAGNLNLTASNTELRFYEGSNYVGFEAPALSADQIWVLPSADGSADQMLKTDGSGNLGWATTSSAADDISTGDAAVTIATSSGNITIDATANDSDIIFKGTDNSSDITMLTLDGSEAGAATFNNKIIATELDISGDVDIDGTLEADAITLDGSAFIKIGGTNFDNSLLLGHATTGTLGGGASNAATKNTGVGTEALISLTTADENTCIGYRSGKILTTGSDNTFIGGHVGYNTVGGAASNNAGIGAEALSGLTSGNWNIALGRRAGNNITTGEGNVVIGHADVSSATGDRQLSISGYDGTTTTSWIVGDNSGNLTFPADATLGDDLYLDSDASVIHLGDDGDVTLTHVADTGVLLNGASVIQFRDSGLTIGSNADGDLDVVSDGTAIDSINLESAGGITLDAGSTTHGITYEDDGTAMLQITNSSSDVIIKPLVDAKDIIFQQYDGTAVLTIEDNATANIPAGKLAIGGTAVTSTAAELNLLDGGTSVGSSITLADADGIVVNDGGTMKTIPASDLKTYNPGGTSWQSVITGATTMVSGRGYFVNTTSSAFTMTLPASPSIGDSVTIIDYAGTFDSNNCTVGRNSQKIHGASEDLTVATERAAFTLVFTDSTQGWLLTNN